MLSYALRIHEHCLNGLLDVFEKSEKIKKGQALFKHAKTVALNKHIITKCMETDCKLSRRATLMNMSMLSVKLADVHAKLDEKGIHYFLFASA